MIENRVGFRQAHDRKWSEILEVFRLVFELSSAHNELNNNNPGQWRRGQGSMTVVEEEQSLSKLWSSVGAVQAVIGVGQAC